MTNSKWLRSALLGGVAVSVMATGAQASELSDLKAQLEALQSQVNTIQKAPVLPAGTSAITVRRGQSTDKRLTSMATDRRGIETPQNRGFTFAVTPTADLPAPTTEITISGHARLYVLWNDEDVATFDVHNAVDGTEDRWNMQARGRVTVRAKTDTAIGQVRALVEWETTSAGGVAGRHAYGEWDMTPMWTFVAGHTSPTAAPSAYGISTVSGTGLGGPADHGRTPLVRLRYTNGPVVMMVAVELPSDPRATSSPDMPDLAAHLQYAAAGGHEVWAGAQVADWGRKIAFYLNGGVNISLGSIATLTTTATFGKGIPGNQYFSQQNSGAVDTNGNPTKALGAGAGISFAVSEATTVNASYGYAKFWRQAAGLTRNSHTVHANILWRPVTQMRLGWEARWGTEKEFGGAKNNVVGAAFGAWFFF